MRENIEGKTIVIPRVEEVASAYLHLITNNFINGQELAVDGGIMLNK